MSGLHSTATSGQGFQPWLGWLLLTAVLVVVVGEAVVLNRLRERADESRRVQTELAFLRADAQELNALEWETIFKGKLDEESSERMTTIRTRMDQRFSRLGLAAADLVQLEQVTRNNRAYGQLVDQEFKLIAAAEIKEAEEFDEANVDPAFATLKTTLEETGAAYDTMALHALALIRTLSLLVLLSGVAFIAVLVWQINRKRHVMQVADAEQRTLRQANETLELRVRERTAELSELNKQMAAVGRLAGMAEVANSVLHNVGNVLNSVNVAAAMVKEKLEHSRLADLPNVADLMRAHAGDLPAFLTQDPQGRQLPVFLEKLARFWRSERTVLLKDVDTLNEHILHIKEIVNQQQALSGDSSIIETLPASEVIGQALALTADLLKNNEVHIRRESEPGQSLRADRVKLMQILVNLVHNAVEAMVAGGGPHREIEFQAGPQPDGTVGIRITDNGPGIAPENLTRIFSYGFTTKQDGHGFGLHSSALAAKEMGGVLHVHSDGPGRGASFTIELPAPGPLERSVT